MPLLSLVSRFTTSIVVSDCKLSNRWRKREGGEDAREEKFGAAKVRETGEQAREREREIEIAELGARSKIKEFAASLTNRRGSFIPRTLEISL